MKEKLRETEPGRRAEWNYFFIFFKALKGPRERGVGGGGERERSEPL